MFKFVLELFAELITALANLSIAFAGGVTAGVGDAAAVFDTADVDRFAAGSVRVSFPPVNETIKRVTNSTAPRAITRSRIGQCQGGISYHSAI